MKKRLSGKLHIVSLGCAKNLIDSEVMGGLARSSGMSLVENPDEADVVIVNTCGFIGPAKEEALDVILTLADNRKKTGRAFKLVVAGCLAQRYGRELARDLPEADLFIGTGEVGRIVGHLQSLREGGSRRAVITQPDFLMTARHERALPPSAAAYLKISDGCSNRCAYCAIPAIRGRARSRPPGDILTEARRLLARGAREIILIGQDTTAYGRDLPGRPTLAALISDLATLADLDRLRLLYAHPAHLSDDLLLAMAAHPAVCRYLDLPVQHIDDSILTAMNRRVSAARIRKIIGRARSLMPDVALRTSLIVGFPGETPRRFARLLDFVREARFDHLGVFTYSREEGTAAAARPARISEKEKERRRDAVMNEQADISYAINQELIGSVEEVLIEERSDRAGYPFVGRARRQAPEIDGVTYLKNGDVQIGDIVSCIITGADHYDLFGEISFDKPGRTAL
ncbi:MAG: 30S ribosomal protein S12 methylthiotransferase RimO [Deltaproteobacteria bacterium]|nr:30S ribosomal protein S12 methylthiotransferase RimO [Deltaproteobacteria bacterium]